jgi:hypothetical protein
MKREFFIDGFLGCFKASVSVANGGYQDCPKSRVGSCD